MATKNYVPKRCIITLGGVQIVGPAAGTFLTVSRDEDSFSKETGAGGDVVRILSHKRGGKAVITLMASSPSNEYLSTVLAIDELTGLAATHFQVEDLNGTTLIFSESAWVMKPADYEAADEHSPRQWTIDLGSVETFIGGLTA